MPAIVVRQNFECLSLSCALWLENFSHWKFFTSKSAVKVVFAAVQDAVLNRSRRYFYVFRVPFFCDFPTFLLAFRPLV